MSIDTVESINQHTPEAPARGPAASDLPFHSDAQIRLPSGEGGCRRQPGEGLLNEERNSPDPAAPADRRSPRTAPSERDFEIFRLAEIQGLTHQQIASIGKVSRRRIGQIIDR